MKPYSSLYPKTKTGKSAEADVEAEDEGSNKQGSDQLDGPKGDIDMWRAVEKAADDGTLHDLRHSKENIPAAMPKREKKKSAARSEETQDKVTILQGRNRRERRAHGVQLKEAEEDSDGGFFE